MPSGPPRHPSDQTLADYALGRLDAMLREPVEAHLAACESCRARRTPPPAPCAGSGASGGFASSVVDRDEATSPSPDSMPRELAEHPDYRVIRELGRGGMGVVYLAENRLMGRKEVLKVVGAHLVRKKNVLERFLREIRAAAQLRHPNIVAAHAASRLGDIVVFSMEYVEGYDLAKLVEIRGPLDVPLACNFIHQAALGLQHAHERGMVHRDVKPSNLMVTREGKRPVLKILDFGLAKVTSEAGVDVGLTNEGQMLGTPHYVAPEQTTDAQNADIRADIYSLGCTLYCLLAGRPPFDAGSLYELLQAHHSKEPAPLTEARPDVPPGLAAVVSKMMAKSAADRHQTPAEAAAALAPFSRPTARAVAAPVAAATTPAEALLDETGPGPIEPEAAWWNGPPRRLVAVAVVTVLLGVVAPAAWLATRPAKPTPVASTSSPPQVTAPENTPAAPVADASKSVTDDDAEPRRESGRAGAGPFAKKEPGARPASEPPAPEQRNPAALQAEPEAVAVAFKADVAAASLPLPKGADAGSVGWKRLLEGPSEYDGREVEVSELFAFTQTPFVRSSSVPGGVGVRLKLRNGTTVSSGNGEIAGGKAGILVDETMAANLNRIMGEAQAWPRPKDPFEVIARFRVDAPQGSTRKSLILTGVEMLCAYDKVAVARGDLDKAFRIVFAGPNSAYTGVGDAPRWIERMGGAKFVDKAKDDLKKHLANLAADQRWSESNVFFNQIASQAALAARRSQAEQDPLRLSPLRGR